MASADLKDAYYSVPIAPEHQKYLKFEWNGKLCFNLCLRQQGHISVSHIDDSYLQGDDYYDCAQNVLHTTKLFDYLGFVIHPDKSSLIPKQQMTILGFTIDSVQMRVYPNKEKADKIKSSCTELLQRSAPSIRQVASDMKTLPLWFTE